MRTGAGVLGMNPDISQFLVEQMENQRCEIQRLETENTELRELVDGCDPLVETYKAESPAYIEWKRAWLTKARRLLR